MPRREIIRHIKEKAGNIAFGNTLYNWSLGRSVPEKIIVTIKDIWPGDVEKGRWLCGGAFAVSGEFYEMRGRFWEPRGISENWLIHMHGFEWLRDLKALGGEEPRVQARGMIDDWIGQYNGWHPQFWRADMAGERIANWIALYDFYGASADDEFQDRLFESIIRQARHISRVLTGSVEGIALLHAIRGLIYAGLSFRGRESWLAQALDALEVETKKQILPDGGHASRSPEHLLTALGIFIDIRNALKAGEYPVPVKLEHNIDRMAQALRFFRYADRGMALFNGTQEGDIAKVDAVLSAANARGKVLSELPHSGYERVTLGRSVLMVDVGAAPAYPYDRDAHAAPLGFEFVYGKARVLTSCGAHPLDPQWQDVLRGTAAHNALTIDNRNACEIRADRHFGRKPRKVTSMREESRDAVLVDASHDGYVPLNGITHRRRLLLSQQGHDLRGEESLTCSVGLGKPTEVAVRFHLHPRVLVSLIREGEEALLRLPSGAGWRFFHNNGTLALENSIYIGRDTRPRKTKQLVIYGTMESDHALIKWALQRESASRDPKMDMECYLC